VALACINLAVQAEEVPNIRVSRIVYEHLDHRGTIPAGYSFAHYEYQSKVRPPTQSISSLSFSRFLSWEYPTVERSYDSRLRVAARVADVSLVLVVAEGQEEGGG
jgi:hypothetical protein